MQNDSSHILKSLVEIAVVLRTSETMLPVKFQVWRMRLFITSPSAQAGTPFTA